MTVSREEDLALAAVLRSRGRANSEFDIRRAADRLEALAGPPEPSEEEEVRVLIKEAREDQYTGCIENADEVTQAGPDPGGASTHPRKQHMSGIQKAVDAAKTQQALADQLGVSQQLISKWVKRGYAPAERAVEIEAQYGVSRRELIKTSLRSLLE